MASRFSIGLDITEPWEQELHEFATKIPGYFEFLAAALVYGTDGQEVIIYVGEDPETTRVIETFFSVNKHLLSFPTRIIAISKRSEASELRQVGHIGSLIVGLRADWNIQKEMLKNWCIEKPELGSGLISGADFLADPFDFVGSKGHDVFVSEEDSISDFFEDDLFKDLDDEEDDNEFYFLDDEDDEDGFW